MMISIIVPIYNIERYLSKCLDSLKSQTFPDVEFILVDDGSTDYSGNIADSFTSDNRYKVFHTNNQGLAAARNFGIEKVHGEWIMFVDGDDWVMPSFCEKAYKVAIDNDADLVIFRSCTIKKGKMIKQNYNNRPVGVVSKEDAIIYGGSVAWNKLYKTALFENIRFPVGQVYEDIATTHKLIIAAKKVVMVDDYLYNQVYRTSSITHTFSSVYRKDSFTSTLQRAKELEGKGFGKKTYEASVWIHAFYYLINTKQERSELYEKAEMISDSIPGFPKGFTWKQKAMLSIWRVDKRLFRLICRILGRQNEERNLHSASRKKEYDSRISTR